MNPPSHTPAHTPAHIPAHIIVLAGDRDEPSALLRAAGVAAKALVPIAGVPMAVRVLHALDTFAPTANRLLIGPRRETLDSNDALSGYVHAKGWQRRSPDSSPALSLATVLESMAGDIAPHRPVLITTADHALLSQQILEPFFAEAARQNATQGADLVVGFTSFDAVMKAFPSSRRTGLKLADGHYCSCNLFALFGTNAIDIIRLWRQVESERKRPWRLLRLIRPALVLRYLTRRLTLATALDAIGASTGATIRAAQIDEPAAAVDVDTVADWVLVRHRVEGPT